MYAIRRLLGLEREIEKRLLTEYEWEYPSTEEVKQIPINPNEEYWGNMVGEAMDNFAISLFKKRASEIGFSYEEVEDVFMRQNRQFFEATKEIKKK